MTMIRMLDDHHQRFADEKECIFWPTLSQRLLTLYPEIMNNLMQRVITGTGLALVIAVSITWNAYSFIFLLCTIDVLAIYAWILKS